jgi:integrase
MKITFLHAGIERTLTKHSAVQRALRLGQLTEAQAKAKPWYLRATLGGSEKYFKLHIADRDAITKAKDILNGQLTNPDDFKAFLQQKDARRSLTLGALANEWITAGLPFRKTEPRTTAAAATLKESLDRALPWWTDKPVATITAHTIEDYAGHRSHALRAADLELSALSSLCKWARLSGKIDANPFEKRATFAKVKQHCHEACPADDETLHRALGWMFDPENPSGTILAGGLLAFCALTGLRPGEPLRLQRQPVLAECPANTKQLIPGTIFPDRTGQLRMKVARLKKGQNPFISLHPAAQSFLSAWKAWLARQMPQAACLFPLPSADQTILNRALNAASAALELPHYKPHGFGRAYYVKVRRSQGADDSTIAGELGQTTNGQLIRNVYGDPDDLMGGKLFDWLPEDTAPAWDLLAMSRICHASPPECHAKMRQDTAPQEPENPPIPAPAEVNPAQQPPA